MRIDIYHHIADEKGIGDKLDQILGILNVNNLKLTQIMNELKDLQAKVAANTTVEESAITLLTGLKASLDAAIASGDPATLTALSTSIDAETQKLAAAITANTPAAPVV